MSESIAIELRPSSSGDEVFLRRLYGSTREHEIASLGWSTEATDLFLTMQFRAREGSYGARFPNADDRIIEIDGRAVGRLLVDRSSDPIVLVDIAVLPDVRGKGIGAGVLDRLLKDAASTGASVRLHVDTGNPARRLYERAGFRVVGRDDLRICMEWTPS